MPNSIAENNAESGVRAINWRNAIFFLIVHAIAILALIPWFFCWTGVALCIVGNFFFGTLGISIGYHRLFTHRGFTCPRWLECTIAVLGCCSGQEAPAFWVAVHRRHHHHADGPDDPHSPLRGFFWGHVGWLLVKNDVLERQTVIDRYARDLRRDPFQSWLIQHDHWIHLFAVSWILLFLTGFAATALMGASIASAAQFGLSLLVWGGAVRTMMVWHMTWFVNSASHLWGYRNYETRDDSRNNIWGGIICNGDGWHNNHHADPRSARHGHKWWEFDLSWLTIRLMMALGLATNVALPSPILATKFGRAGRQAPLPDFDAIDSENAVATVSSHAESTPLN
ncbi:MAG TPA: fatty acid desaturase [Xanthobacteraceae bacterium]|nr:fatty acid desaturase [Xanthobacteraceae bacterium]